MCKFDLDYVCVCVCVWGEGGGGGGKLLVAISLGDAWGISRIRLPGQFVLAFLFLSPRTVPNVSAYRPDYLFQTVIGILGGHPSR